MAEIEQKFGEEEAAKVRACLAKVIASEVFAQAKRQKRLLEYLTAETLAGRANLLKGYTIGVEVFDRDPSFDPGIDAIVRVEAARLRNKLLEYYAADGSSDPIRIELPKGSYFVRVSYRGGETGRQPEAPPVTRRLAAILCADVKGYSHLMEKDEGATVRTLSSHGHVIAGLMDSHSGRIVSTAGDGFLAEFGSVVDAVNCAVAIQRKLGEENAALEGDSRLDYRIGINLGDIIIQEKTVFGDGVNISARLESLARPGNICISGSVYDQVKRKLPLSYEDAGLQKLKNIEEPVHVYHIRIAGPLPPAAPLPAPPGISPSALVAPTDKPSLAVLPFANMSSDPEQEYFADGITEDLITEFSKLSGLFVIARHSAFVYKGVRKNIQEIGKELGVRYLIEGSVRRAGERVRITAQLIDAASGAHVWAERYDRDLKDIFDVQDDVTRRIVDTLHVTLSPVESQRIGHEGTVSIEAHDMMLRGLERFWTYSPDGTADAQALFLKALELDPNYAAAHGWVARTMVYQWAMRWIEGDILDRALEHATAAVRLDDHLPFSYFALGWVLLWRRQKEEAIAAGRRAVALDPNNADSQMFLSLSLSAADRGEESLTYITSAMRLNPHPALLYVFALGQCYYVMKKYDEAIAAFKWGVQLGDQFPPNHLYLAAIYSELGRTEEAAAERDRTFAAAGSRKLPVIKMMMFEGETSRRLEENSKRIGLA